MGSTIVELQVGSGPAGELRYPSYQMDKWSFCGVGAFQSYSPLALSSLQTAAAAVNHPEWAQVAGPSNAGSYNSKPYETEFFSDNGGSNYRSDYGQFYLGWYADALLAHGEALLSAAQKVVGDSGVSLSLKVGDVCERVVLVYAYKDVFWYGML